MPVFHIEIKRKDPHSSAYETIAADVSTSTMIDAIEMTRDAANVNGNAEWIFSNLELHIRENMTMEGEGPKKRKPLLCRLLCCGGDS